MRGSTTIEIGALARLERADLALEPERRGAAQRRQLERGRRRHRRRAGARLVQQRRQPQLDEAVEVVVARRAVGAERDVDALRQHLRDGRDAAAQLEVRRGAVHDVRAARRQPPPLVVGGVDAVGEGGVAGRARPSDSR